MKMRLMGVNLQPCEESAFPLQMGEDVQIPNPPLVPKFEQFWAHQRCWSLILRLIRDHFH